MNRVMPWVLSACLVATVSCRQQARGPDARSGHSPAERQFQVKGMITEISPDRGRVVIKHEAIPGYMPAMTMPFRVRQPDLVSGLRPGDGITFRLHVTDDESWIDTVTSTLTAASDPGPARPAPPAAHAPALNLLEIPNFALTNELGQRVSLHQFRGQAVALTFFFTRCPIPEYCPRLSRSFAQAIAELRSRPGAPTNWHFLSISFDPQDTPEVLRAYAQRYQYDSNHWSFLTGDPAHVRALTHGFGIQATPQEGFFNHDFRTAVFDANGQLQTLWPFGGDTTQMLVQELTKGAAAAPSVRAGSPKGPGEG